MRYKVAAVASHPVQYQAPWYRALAALVDLEVFFAHRATPLDQARGGFGVPFDWDVPVADGYPFQWLHNRAAAASVETFWGCDTPEIGEKLAAGGFDAVIVNGWQLYTYWQAVHAARRHRLLTLVRGDSQLAPRGIVRRTAKQLVYPRLLRLFDGCLAVGVRSQEYYRHYGVPADRIFASPHCVDNAFFAGGAAAARRQCNEERARLALPSEAVVFVFAGKLVAKKRPMDFLAALDVAASTGAPVYGLIVGDGPLRAEVEAHCRTHRTRCALAGFVNQSGMARIYAAADALVLPSDADETWGLVVNETMACGVPAVVSDAAGCAPDLIVEGRTGLSYPCGHVGALAAQLGRLAADPALRTRLGQAAETHIAGYSPEAAAAGVVAALDRLTSTLHSRGPADRSPVVDAVS
jgi:glycosyltransferase involved in cell wall biosynthesis